MGYINLFLLVFLYVSYVANPVFAASDNAVQRVLHIDSYHTGYTWSDGISKGIHEEFRKSGLNVEISTEHLDSRRFTEKPHIELFAEALRKKYESYPFDIVIASDNAAFDFAANNREVLFRDVPIVFCGYNFFSSEAIRGIKNITGINEEIDVLGNVEMAFRVFPKTTLIVFIISTGDLSSKRIAEKYKSTVYPLLASKYEVLTLEDSSIDEIKELLSPIPKESLVFLLGQTKDRSLGRNYTPEENGRIISSISPVPVFTFWDIHLNTGVLGGNILRGEDQGRKAAEIAIRILRGERSDSIPVIMKTPVTAVFDYRVIKRFGISMGQLPQDSKIINKPTGIWELYRGYILWGIATFIIMALLIILLLFNIKQKIRAMLMLKEERAQLNSRIEERTAELKQANESLKLLWYAIEQTSESVLITDREGNITYVNPAFINVTGYSREEIIGQNPRILKSNIHGEEFYRSMWETLIKGHIWTGEICNRNKRGELFWEQATISPIIVDKEITHFLGIKKDITEHKNAERLREDVERIMRHDLKSPLNAVINIPELLLEDENLTDLQRNDLMLIRQAGKVMLQQINMSLDLYKMENKTYHFSPSLVNLYDVMSKVTEMLKTISEEKGIKIHIASEECESQGDNLNVLGEEILCRNLFQNLLKNAIEASPKDKDIVISINRKGNSLFVNITNEGTVPEDVVPFFFQKYSTSGKKGGTGLGTYSARLMAEVQGGRISLHTDDRPSVTVTVELPCVTET